MPFIEAIYETILPRLFNDPNTTIEATAAGGFDLKKDGEILWSGETVQELFQQELKQSTREVFP